jgi:zinc protease
VTGVPEARFDEHLRATLYGLHPYGVPVLGWPDEEQRLTAQDITTFYHTWYAPNNAILIVAGDVTAAQLAPLLQRYYGSIPARPVPARHRLTAPRPQGGQRLVMQAPHVRKPLWKRIYLAPSYNAGDTRHVYALQVLVELLAEEQVGLLYRSLVAEQRLATAVGVDYIPDSVGVTDVTVYAAPVPGVDVAVLERAIAQALEAVVAQGVSRTEVQRAQRRLQRQAPSVRAYGHITGEPLGMALATGRTLVEVGQWRERIAAVTQEQVHAAAQAVLRAERSVTGVLLPAAASDAARGKRARSISRECTL